MARTLTVLLTLALVVASCGNPDETQSQSPVVGGAQRSTPDSSGTTTVEDRIDPSTAADPTSTATKGLPASTEDVRLTVAALLSKPFNTCEESVDIALEVLQIWLDSMDGIPFEAIFGETTGPPEWIRMEAEFEGLVEEREIREAELGCDEDHLGILLYSRLNELYANNPTAEQVLAYLASSDLVTASIATPEATATFPPTELNWNISSCEDAADLFIGITQILLNELSDTELSDFVSDESPESIREFEESSERFGVLVEEFGCSDGELMPLIVERADSLRADGPVANLLLDDLLEAIEDGGIFQERSTEPTR